jgi:hypothetical protein
VIAWSRLVGLIDRTTRRPRQGRQPSGLEKMLHVYFLQQWFNLSDPRAGCDLLLRRAGATFRAGGVGRRRSCCAREPSLTLPSSRHRRMIAVVAPASRERLPDSHALALSGSG